MVYVWNPSTVGLVVGRVSAGCNRVRRCRVRWGRLPEPVVVCARDGIRIICGSDFGYGDPEKLNVLGDGQPRMYGVELYYGF